MHASGDRGFVLGRGTIACSTLALAHQAPVVISIRIEQSHLLQTLLNLLQQRTIACGTHTFSELQKQIWIGGHTVIGPGKVLHVMYVSLFVLIPQHKLTEDEAACLIRFLTQATHREAIAQL